MKILVRGDCTSQRAIGFNEDLFGNSPELVVDSMTPSQLLLDALEGLRADRHLVESHLDLSQLDATQYGYFASQFEQKTLSATIFDLIVMDSYADMKFHLYQHRMDGWRFWADRTIIKDEERFFLDFLAIGRPNLRESAGCFERLIRHYRKSGPEVPVLFLSQLTAYRPSDHRRRSFERLGSALARRIPNLWWGGRLPKASLVPEDLEVDGDTYHFAAHNYRTMIERAIENGLPLGNVLAKGRGRQVVFYDTAGTALTADSVLEREFGLQGVSEVPKALVAVGPFSACPSECSEFVERRFTSKMGEYLLPGAERPGWPPRYFPMAASLKELATQIEDRGNDLKVHSFARAHRKAEVDRLAAIWRGDEPGQALPPQEVGQIPSPSCKSHWGIDFGLFEQHAGGGRLVALVHVVRVGELLIISQAMDEDGQSATNRLRLLLGELARMADDKDSVLHGASTFMYAGMENGNIQLMRFKAALGLRPLRIRWEKAKPARPAIVGDAQMAGRNKISSYRRFLTTHMERGLSPIKYATYAGDQSTSEIVLLRHDVDHSLVNALMLAEIEKDMGICSTYFMLHPGDYNSHENYYGRIQDGRIVHSKEFLNGCLQIQDMGHEVGLHNDFIQLAHITGRSPRDLLNEEVVELRKVGIAIKGTASHGSDFARRNGFANYELFTECVSSSGQRGRTIGVGDWKQVLHSVSMKDVGLTYESYFVHRNADVSDTGSALVAAFGGRRFNSIDLASDEDFEGYSNLLRKMPIPLNLQVLVHPCWWVAV